MKQILTSLTLLIMAMLLPAAADAQLFNRQAKSAASWSAKAEMKSKTAGVITITASIEPGWHIYGLQEPKEAPVATEISFTNTGIRLSGNISTDPAPKKKHDDVFGVDVTYWDSEKVTFTQPFKVIDSTKAHSQVKITFIGCSGLNCSAPETVTIDVDIPKYTKK